MWALTPVPNPCPGEASALPETAWEQVGMTEVWEQREEPRQCKGSGCRLVSSDDNAGGIACG